MLASPTTRWFPASQTPASRNAPEWLTSVTVFVCACPACWHFRFDDYDDGDEDDIDYAEGYIAYAYNAARESAEGYAFVIERFLGEVAGLSAAPTYREAKAEGILDAQIGYDFNSGPLKGLSILAQAKNLTDRPFVTYQNNDPRQVIDYQRYGRDYYLGLAYKF